MRAPDGKSKRAKTNGDEHRPAETTRFDVRERYQSFVRLFFHGELMGSIRLWLAARLTAHPRTGRSLRPRAVS
jgi:hypothetical protein